MRGWVLDADAEPEAVPAELRPLAKVSSRGPTSELIDLAEWAAWRWGGSRPVFLRLTTPPNVVAPDFAPAPRGRSGPGGRQPADDGTVEEIAAEARAESRGVVRWPPAARMAELLRRLVAPEGSSIIVLPDAERAGRLVRFLERAGVDVTDVRAGLSAAERTRSWRRALAGATVVVGGRTAVWAPVPDLAAVMVVDDADEALKDERAPTWHARDVGLERALRGDARVTVVSPVPTLEALATTTRVLAPPRAEERDGWGRLAVIDRREEPPGTGMFSEGLADLLRGALPSGRAVCVLNRKGRARLLACGSCSELVRCDRCGAAVAEDEEGLLCNVCGERRPRICAVCSSTVLKRLRPGISRLREELEGLLPRHEAAEVDADVADLPDAPVLIGTEAVLHRVPDAALVAFLDFDQELLAARYRAPEQALWLIVRALRRTGSRSNGGAVALQTRIPEHPVVEAARGADPGAFAESELSRRGALGFPPFGALAEATGSDEAVEVLADLLTGTDGLDVLGPVEESGRTRLLLRAEGADGVRILGDALAGARTEAREHGRLRIDVDPLRA